MRKIKLFFGVSLCFILGTASVLAIVYRQLVVDQIVVWNFSASNEIVQLVDRAGMGPYGKFLYLASQPSLDSTQRFNSVCERTETVTSILGCYVSGQIYLYDITDSELDGIRETTAVHETLHAAYVRLSDSEKTSVNKLLQVEYKKLLEISEYKSLLDYYDRAEPGQQDNELHSIIGTEISDISPELEAYYGKYFSDRKLVVALNEKYKDVFRKLDKKANDLSTEIKNLAVSISTRTDKYNSDTNILNQDIEAFNQKAASGGFSTSGEFNYNRNKLIGRIDTISQLKTQIEADLIRYDELVVEFNSINTKSEKLSNSINSSLAPSPSVLD